GSGVIVRTAAEGATEQQLADDIARLTKQWADIEAKQKKTKSAPVLLRGEPELAVRVVRDVFNEDFNKLAIEGRETYDTVSEYVQELSPELSDRVEQWVGPDDAFHAFRIDEQLAKGMDRKVWLPSGGTLIIDRTEAMTVIDVNTGKYIGAGGTLEETVTRNNLEAAEEIVRQMRLRDIGGIIIVDFVDMVLESNRDLVLRRLVECLGRDRTRHQVTEITSLGLVQMTRKRVGEGLVEAFSTPCEVCEGRGFIVHHEPVENTGSADHTGGGHGSGRGKGRKTVVEEPRRLDEGADRGRTREALSAIAAASGHASRSTDEGGPAVAPVASTHPEVVANTVAAESGAGADGQSGAAGAESDDAAATRTRGSRRRRAVKASSAEPGASRSHEVPEVEAEVAAAPVESLLVSAEGPEDVQETELVPVTKTKRRRVARSSGETAPVKTGGARTGGRAAVEASAANAGGSADGVGAASERVAGELAEASAGTAPESAPAKATSRRRSGHRRVASSGTVDTGAAELPVPESVDSEAQAAGTAAGSSGRKSRTSRSRATASSIELPEPKVTEVKAPSH
ncbi:MAG: ribonuclease E/G, partial [Pauljensenia sp.]